MMAMDGTEDVVSQVDTEFDRMLVEMKPFVLRLPHKSDRQRCALWIKKFCEPQVTGLTGRRNRNLYAQLLLHMLKKGVLEGPFTERPESGALPSLPSYLLEEIQGGISNSLQDHVPDWVAGELGSEVSGVSSIHPEHRDPFPLGHFPTAQLFSPDTDIPQDRDTHRKSLYGRERSPSPVRSRSRERGHPAPPLDPMHFGKAHNLFGEENDTRTVSIHPGEASDLAHYKGDPLSSATTESDLGDWRNGLYSTTFGSTTKGNSLFKDDISVKPSGREVEMRTKMMEARFQEEKLRLQQKHDATVQKILERKNAEIEDLKSQHRHKSKEHEDSHNRKEKKVASLQKELSHVKESKDREINELRRVAEDTSNTRHQELEKKLQDVVSEFEQEKFELQKQHTRNIQELLEDTNTRLQRMEHEYSSQTDATSALIRELESRVQQVTGEAEQSKTQRNQLERDKMELQGQVDRLQADNMSLQDKLSASDTLLQRAREDHEQELRAIRNKHDANSDFSKQENQLAAVKAADTISELEHQVSHLKQALDAMEQQRLKQTRDKEQTYDQDKHHLQQLHDQKVRSLQSELDRLQQDYQKRIRKLDHALREKDVEVSRMVEQQRHQGQLAEAALEEFKQQVERNSTKMYHDMKQQMEKVEADLHRSKQLREKQSKESGRSMEEEKRRCEQQISDLRLSHEQQRAQLMREFHAEQEQWAMKHEKEQTSLRESLQSDVLDTETRSHARQEADTKTISELEQQVAGMREEAVQANHLRKQQLVELGLLREEEKQKMLHDHDAQMTRIKSEAEQIRLEMEKQHSSEMEKILEQTNSKLKEIEREYSSRSCNANETISELQLSTQKLRDELNRHTQEAAKELSATVQRMDEEKRHVKKQHSNTIYSSQQELESQKTKIRQLERRALAQQQDHEEQMTLMRAQYEERLRGLIPTSVRQELEDTITSLKSQIQSLQQRCCMLQEEVDASTSIPTRVPTSNLAQHFSASLNTLSSTHSLKSNA